MDTIVQELLTDFEQIFEATPNFYREYIYIHIYTYINHINKKNNDKRLQWKILVTVCRKNWLLQKFAL